MADQKDRVQGEGDYESARRYDDDAHKFAQSGKVKPAADKAKPGSAEEAEAMERAEQAGRARAKEEDPEVKRRH